MQKSFCYEAWSASMVPPSCKFENSLAWSPLNNSTFCRRLCLTVFIDLVCVCPLWRKWSHLYKDKTTFLEGEDYDPNSFEFQSVQSSRRSELSDWDWNDPKYLRKVFMARENKRTKLKMCWLKAWILDSRPQNLATSLFLFSTVFNICCQRPEAREVLSLRFWNCIL